ncbi:GNAT family N-acetyltransferase [bacterium]|nr:GNAT family N-acetyltransferase [bacterium]
MSNYPELHTDRLVLRAFQLSDATEVQMLAGAREVAEMTLNIPHPYSNGLAENWISSHKKDFEAGMGMRFAIVEKETAKLIGAIGLIITERFNRAELGYWVGKPYWGKGFATEATKELLRYGFQELKLNKVYATHMTRNPASGRVLQKIGMQLEGLLKQHALKWDQFVDLAAYGILAESWHSSQKH